MVTKGQGACGELRLAGKVEASDGKGKLDGFHSPASVDNQVEAICT